MVQTKIKIPIITGPTASGKTSLIFEIAKQKSVEIISCDSRQVYIGMDIGTAKPSKEERKRVYHHLIDIVKVNERYSAGKFTNDALRSIKEILDKGKLPVIVGGTGLYIDAIVKGISANVSVPEEIREKVKKDWDEDRESLLNELKSVDEEMYNRLHPNDKQRIIRAIEVYRYTGIPLSVWWRKGEVNRTDDYEFDIMTLSIERNMLKKRIKDRVYKMLEMGWIDEVEGLLKRYKKDDYGMKTVGYKEIVQFLEGNIEEDELPDKIYVSTWRYAKRQITWFKRYNWYSADEIFDRVIKWRL